MKDLSMAGPAARAVGLNAHTLYKLARRNLVPCYRAGRALRFDVDEIREWMRQQAQQEGGTDELANQE